MALALASAPHAVAAPASSSPRFGDSTWVAPGPWSGPTPPSPEATGPRVARPDHERAWESVLRAPFRLAFLPVRFVARGAESAVGPIGSSVSKFVKFPGAAPTASAPPHASVSPGISVWLAGQAGNGLGPSLKVRGFPVASSTLRLKAAWTTRDNRRALARETVGADTSAVGLDVEAGYHFRPNRLFYGIGNESLVEDKSIYLEEEGHVDGGPWLGRNPLRRVRLLGGYSDVSARRGYGGVRVETVFPTLPLDHTQVVSYGIGGDLGALDSRVVPSRGLEVRGEVRRNVDVGGDLDLDYVSWRLDTRAYVRVFAPHRTIALRAVYVGVEPRGSSDEVPFYRLPESSTEHLKFPGYASGRFKDKRLFLGQAEYRWWIWHHVQAVILGAIGEVAPSASALRLADVHPSIGGGLRVPISSGTIIRVELVHGDDGTKFTIGSRGDY